MDEIKIELRIYSPRWGHYDTYSLRLSRDVLVITCGARSVRATYREHLDPEWTGEPLVDILRNDSIYPPEIFQRLIEYAWLAWRGGELTDESVQEELQALADWLNEITKSKPSSDFWRGYF